MRLSKLSFLVFVAIFATSTLYFTSCSSSDDEIKKPEIIIPKTGTENIKAFENVKVAFGDGFTQSAIDTFKLPTEIDQVESIKMYIQNPCTNKECDEWDRYANVYVKNKTTDEWYEIARFITPYWVGNEKLERGWEIDVTDFKSLLTGDTELKIYTETWGAKGRVYSVEFDYNYGPTAYKYSAVVPLMQYNKSSIDGIEYGVAQKYDLNKTIKLPKETELAYLRTTISGWGHATPSDKNGNPCAEWCYRTHQVLIDGAKAFDHYLGPIGCANNPINNQAPGNWKPDRAGWCPGMVVEPFFDVIQGELSNRTFKFNYEFENWKNNNPENKAFYAISSFIVVKSNKPIELPIVQ